MPKRKHYLEARIQNLREHWDAKKRARLDHGAGSRSVSLYLLCIAHVHDVNQILLDESCASLLPPCDDCDVPMTAPSVTVDLPAPLTVSWEPELTPISKSKRAQARFANALADIIAPRFGPFAHRSTSTISPPPIASTSPHSLQAAVAIEATTPATNSKQWVPPVRIENAALASQDLNSMLHPKRIRKGSNGIQGRAAKAFICDDFSRQRFIAMEMLLNIYSHPHISEHLGWMAASLRVARSLKRGAGFAVQLRQWCRNYIEHRILPENLYGKWTASMLDDGDLAHGIFEHLTSIGQYIQAHDVVHYLNDPDVRTKYGLKKGISLQTATRWMSTMGYRWGKTPKGDVLMYSYAEKYAYTGFQVNMLMGMNIPML